MPLESLAVAKSSIRRARRFLLLAQEPLSDSKVKNDLRRMAIVMSIAAVDSYMHRLVLQRVSKVRDGGELPSKLASVTVSFEDLASAANASVAARRDGKDGRPWVHAKNVLHQRLLKATFQSSGQVTDALTMAGIEKPWKQIALGMGETVVGMQKRLDHLVYRRNQIVHESDVPRKSKPRHLEFNDVDHATVVADVDWAEKLICAIDVVAKM